MNDEINFLYDEYRPIRLSTIDFYERHYYSPDDKCFIYRTCWYCENKTSNELIQGMIYCKYNIKPDSQQMCSKYNK
jgi:hypothetical protein